MIRQLTSLLALSIGASIGVAYVATPMSSIAADLVDILGPVAAVDLAAHGSWPAYLALQTAKIKTALPWFTLGAGIAVAARTGLWLWTSAAPDPEKVVLRDEAGGTVQMYGSNLSHDPGIRFLSVGPNDRQLSGANEFENELFAAICEQNRMPADLNGDHGQLLCDAVESAWLHVVRTHGAGSLASMLLISHQSGKRLAYQKSDKGWVAASDKFAQQSLVVVRRMRTFYKLPNQIRDDLMRCLSVLSSHWVPTDMPEELRNAVRDVRIADMQPASKAGGAAKRGSGDVDVRAIATLISDSIIAGFGTFNVNQSRSKSEALDALYIKKDVVLLVPPKQMRDAIGKLVPAEVAATLKLAIPAASRHPSDSIVGQILDKSGLLVKVYKQVSCSSGVFGIRSGQRKFTSVWALSAKNVNQQIIDQWGDWPYDVEVLGPGEIHVQ